MRTLLIISDPPYGTERAYNGLRLALSHARGLTDQELVEGSRRSTLEELTDWTLWADKVLVF